MRMENLIYLVFLNVACLLTNHYCKKVAAAVSPMHMSKREAISCSSNVHVFLWSGTCISVVCACRVGTLCRGAEESCGNEVHALQHSSPLSHDPEHACCFGT